MYNENNNDPIINEDSLETPYSPIDSPSSFTGKTSGLETAKQEKLNKLSNKNQNANLDNSYSQLEDGSFVSNRNKIYNDLSDQEFQDTLKYAITNMSLTSNEEGSPTFGSGESYDGRTRRLYMFGTKDKTNEQVKLGLARGDLKGSEGRYIPNSDGTYGWVSGDLGVDTNDKQMDILFPDNVATMIEGMAFGRKSALSGRVLQDRKEEYTPYNEFTHSYKDSENTIAQSSKIDFPEGLLGKALDKIATARGWEDKDIGTVLEFMDKVGNIESNNVFNRTQEDNKDGIGRGKYQYELSTGSGANKTAVNRLFQAISTLDIELSEISSLDRQILVSEDPDFSKLSEDVQDLAFLTDKLQAGDTDLDAIAKGDISLKDAWLDTHWRGSEEDRSSKSAMWDKRFGDSSERSNDQSFLQKGDKRVNLSQEEFDRRTSEIIRKSITSNNYDDYGSGGSEYYTSKEALLGKETEYNKAQGKAVFDKYLADMEDRFPRGGIVNKEAYLERQLKADQKWAAQRYGILDRVGNTVSGFASTFVKELIINPVDAVGDLTGLYDIGTDEEKNQYVDDTFGYNPATTEIAMEEVGKQWDILTNSESSTSDRVRAAGNGILEAFTTPELLGSSLGALMSWLSPGAVLKAVGIGSKYAKTAKSIDKLVETGELTRMQAKGMKLKELATIDGMKASLTSQSGFIVSALGNVNNQYEEFVGNNNGVALEGEEKAKWFAGRFAVQMVNQNLDKIIDVNILKNPGAIAALVPAIKAMTKKEFSNVAKVMGKGVVKTVENSTKEAAQEYTQTMMELFNSRYGSAQFANATEFSAFITDERNTREAGIASLAGAGGASQFDFVGGILPAVAATTQAVDNKVQSNRAKSETLSEEALKVQEEAFTPAVALDTVSEEQIAANSTSAKERAASIVDKYISLIGDTEAGVLLNSTTEQEEGVKTPVLSKAIKDNIQDYEGAIQEIEEAEAIYASTSEDTSLEEKILRKSKREIYNSIMDSESPVLGSNYTPEDVLEDFIDAVDVVDNKLDLTPEENIRIEKYAKDNDIPTFRFTSIVGGKIKGKDATEVQNESVGDGPRSVTSYRNTLRTLVNTPNPDRSKIAKTLGSINNFLNSQETRKAAFDGVLKEVTTDIGKFNKTVTAGKKLTITQLAQKKSLIGKNSVKGYPTASVVVQEKGDGTLSVNDNSVAISKSMQDTIGHLNRTKARYENKANTLINPASKLQSSNISKGIYVRPNTKFNTERTRDDKSYQKRGVTKVVVDLKNRTSKWADKSDYQKDNQGKVNTGTYTKEDIVVFNSTATNFPQGGTIRRQLAAIQKVGATIVLDTDTVVNTNQPLKNLLGAYKYKAATQNGQIIYTPAKQADVINAKAKETKVADKAETKSLDNLVKALAIKEVTRESELTKEERTFYTAALTAARGYFSGNMKEMKAHYNREIDKIVKKGSDRLIGIATTTGISSPEFGEAILDLQNSSPKGVFSKIDKASSGVITQLQMGEETLSNWNEAFKLAKLGRLDEIGATTFDEWLNDNIANPMGVVKDMLSNAIGVGKKTVYAYANGLNDFLPTTDKNKIPKDKEGNLVNFQVLEIDPNNYVVVNRTTPLNTLNLKDLKVSDDIMFNSLVTKAVELLGKTLKTPDLEYNGVKGSTNNFLDFSNSPVSSLIFDQDLKLNENVAITAHIALKNFLKDNSYLIMKGKKTKKDLAEILGIDESQISRDAVEMLADKGLLYKTAANSVGKNMASMLGLARKSDSAADSQAYDALIADLGQTALLMGVEEGILNVDNSLKAIDFAETVMSKDKDAFNDGNDAKVIFIEAVKGKEEEIQQAVNQAREIGETIPDTNPSRKEPLFSPMSKKRIADSNKKMRKEKLGLSVANDSQESIKELMSTEWEADIVLAKELLENQESIMPHMGFIVLESDKYKALSFEGKESQLSINRSIEKSFEEMGWLIANSDGERTSLWFDYFFSKNGRFFIDSNTINPQNGKHLDRFYTQPKSHSNKFTRKRDNQFFIGNKNVSNNVYYAIAQGFGYATDKKDTAKIKKQALIVLATLNTKEKIAQAKKEFLAAGNYAVTNEVDENGKSAYELSVEHIGHAMQTFAFLEKALVTKGKPTASFTSSLSAEFDAVTSGFGIKSLQMPIINNMYEWLKKVGVVLDTDDVLKDTNIKAVSMNNLLDEGGVSDSYQTLAKGVEGFTFEGMIQEVNNTFEKNPIKIAVSDSDYSRNLWEALHQELPKVIDGAVSKELRSLFKYPFMTFNYAASIKSIRKNLLTGDLLSTLASSMAKADLTDADSSIVKLMKAFLDNPKNDKKLLEAFQEKVRTMPTYAIRSKENVGKTLEEHLGQMIEATYGAKVEEILTDQFAPFIKAQDDVNNGFKAMFEVFGIAFEKELAAARKNGAVSQAKEREIYDKLKDKWPMIKGPLSNMEEELISGDGIGIYDTKTASPYGEYSGRKASRANLSKSLVSKLGQKTIRVSHMVKQMVSSVAAGSVLPVHFIDGAIMARTINNLANRAEKDGGPIKGITSVHDAIIPSLLYFDEAQEEYNKQMIQVNSEYSFINEIAVTLDRFMDSLDITDKVYTDRKVTISVEGKKEEISVKEFLLSSRNDVADLANRVNEGRKKMYNELDKGSKIMHMAGTPGGVYSVTPGSIGYKPIDKYAMRQYTTDIKVNGKTVKDLNVLANNLKCKG
jgi:hypothetical protein